MPHMTGAKAPQFPEGWDPNAYSDIRTSGSIGDSRNWAAALGNMAVGAADWSSMATATAAADPLRDLNKLLETFDFDNSTDEDVLACEREVFKSVKKEAGELTGSWLTSGLVQSCVLRHPSLPDALAALLSGKVHEPLPGAFAYSSVGGTRAEVATAEEALRDTMKRIFCEPAVRRAIVSDLVKVLVVDPAADGLLQPMLFFKGFHALTTYRVGHSLWCDGSPASRGAALMLQSRAAELFGVDIHPGASIGNGVMLDHASGIVIGSTAVVGSDVYMLHGTTLGATGKPTFGAKRHPTIGSRVVLGAGCTVLGDITVGDDCTVGAAGIVTKDVPAGSTVVGVNKIVSREEPPPDSEAAAKSAEPSLANVKVSDDDYTWMYDI